MVNHLTLPQSSGLLVRWRTDRPHRGWLQGLHGANPIPAGFGTGDRTRLSRSGYGLLPPSGGWLTIGNGGDNRLLIEG